MIVLSVTTGLLKLLLMLVAPCNVIPFVILRVEVQLAVPAGTVTVSPSRAEAMADLTSASSALFASTVAPLAWPAATRNLTVSAANDNEGCVTPTVLSSGKMIAGVYLRTTQGFKILFRRIGQRSFRFQSVRFRGFRYWLVFSPWIPNSYDEENEPGEAKPFKRRFCQIVEDDSGKKAQLEPTPIRISKQVNTYFAKCCYNQAQEHE